LIAVSNALHLQCVGGKGQEGDRKNEKNVT